MGITVQQFFVIIFYVKTFELTELFAQVTPARARTGRTDFRTPPMRPKNAEKWIDFLCRPDIAKKNFEYITYATPNTGAYDLLDDDLKNNKALFPDLDKLPNCEIIQYLGDDVDTIYNDMWKEIKSE